jgi:hypothetical protein
MSMSVSYGMSSCAARTFSGLRTVQWTRNANERTSGHEWATVVRRSAADGVAGSAARTGLAERAPSEDGLVAEELVERARLVREIERAAKVLLLKVGEAAHLLGLDGRRQLLLLDDRHHRHALAGKSAAQVGSLFPAQNSSRASHSKDDGATLLHGSRRHRESRAEGGLAGSRESAPRKGSRAARPGPRRGRW